MDKRRSKLWDIIMSNVRAVVLDEKKSVEMGYETAEMKSVVEDVEGESVFVNADAISMAKVVGIVTETYYENATGLVVECDIVDDDVEELIEMDLVQIAPRLIVNEFTDYYLEDIDGLFTTSDPEYVVGETEVIE